MKMEKGKQDNDMTIEQGNVKRKTRKTRDKKIVAGKTRQ